MSRRFSSMKYKVIMKRYLILGAGVGITLCVLAAVLLFLDKPRGMIEMVLERPRIEKSLREYFAAEMSRDYSRVYRCLAPSSHYRRTHSYEDFLADMRSNQVQIVEYKLVDIYGLRPNHDKAAYPAVERFAQAEVDVEIKYGEAKRKVLCNYCFTFLKEGGAWFKG
jgi:hypothetical protein